MQIIKNTLENIVEIYPIEKLGEKKDILFIDIETTGFTARTSKLYMIGAVYFDTTWNTVQFFADDTSQEAELLEEFFKFAGKFTTLVHFNGNNFDIPYLEEKCREFNLPFSFETYKGIDIYRRISFLKDFLKLENCKQKTIEKFLGIERQDIYTGGDLIGMYHEYVDSKDESKKEFLLLHNFEDLKGMLEILPILSYIDMILEKQKVTKVTANYYQDEAGNQRSEVIMTLTLNNPLKTPISFMYNKCFFSGGGDQGMIRVPLYEEEMKYFYADYKDYYYLPAEDTAIHKSVAKFVDKNYREPAKASNCYTKKSGKFLQQWGTAFVPFFKRDYDSKEVFFELTDERKTDRELFSTLAHEVLIYLSGLEKHINKISRN